MTWEQRWHPLREEWVIVAAHRNDRPWTGQTVAAAEEDVPEYEPQCPLCPGNVRVSGAKNDEYDGVFVFDNDLPCVGPDAPAPEPSPHAVFRSRTAEGMARVVCYDPRHNVTLAELHVGGIRRLLDTWRAQFIELAARREVEHVLIFENKGRVVGVSNPHPHCQIYATNFVFKTIAVETDASRRHIEATGNSLLGDIIAAEKADGRRVIRENGTAIAFIPYFARYAYETFVAPKQCHASIAGLSDEELADLAAVLKEVLVRFDNLWKMSFPYVLALHQAPCDGRDYPGFHFHMEFHPPLRRPNLLKYLAGPEIGGGSFLSDTSAEEKAAELRDVDPVHWRQSE